MGGPRPPRISKPPPAPDLAKARINAMAYSEIERRIRSSQGRSGQFIASQKSGAGAFKTLLGQ